MPKTKVVRTLRVRGWYSRDPDRICKVELEIDQEAILEALAPKALNSKGKQARSMRGAVRVKILETLS